MGIYVPFQGVDGDHEGDVQLSRPLGVDVLILGYDTHGFGLWHIDPSGAYIR